LNEKQYFSIKEAETLIPHLEKRMKKLMFYHAALEKMEDIEIEYQDEFEQIVHDVNFNSYWHELSFKLFSELRSLLKMGIIVKDLDLGLADFFSFHENREIYLCYRFGETSITHWHEVEETYEERKPVEELMNKL